MRFTESIKEFEEKVLVHNFWKYYEIKAVLGRSKSTEPWKTLFLFVRLDTQGKYHYNTIFDSDYLRIVEETHDFQYFRDFLLKIFEHSSYELRENTFLEFMHDNPSYESIDREKAEKTIGIGFSGNVLYLKGGRSSTLQTIEDYIGLKLLVDGNPPYVSLDDFIREKLKINRAWDYEGSDFESRLLFMVLAPNFFRFEQPEVKGNDLFIRVSTLRNPKGPIKVTVIGKKGGRISYRKLIEFNEDDWKNGELTRIIKIDEQSTVFELWLSYNGSLVDSLPYDRPDKVLQRTLWIRSLIKSIDPEYRVLERWITGTSDIKGDSRKLSPDFENGISVLFSLCGLNSVHVGNTYEKATQKSKAMLQSSRMKLPIDVFAWSSLKSNGKEILYLVQCILAGSGEDLMTKINDVASAGTVVYNMLSDHLVKPEIVPVVITNMTKIDTVYEQKQASERNVKIVSKEDLMFLLHGIRNDDPFINNEVKSIMQDQAAASRQKTNSFGSDALPFR